MSETTFENAKVGDKVWSVMFGWGKIIGISKDSDYPIRVEFAQPNTIGTFMLDGVSFKCENRTLFWDEIKITPPERPKRKVKKSCGGMG